MSVTFSGADPPFSQLNLMPKSCSQSPSEPLSNLPVSPLITPIVVPYIIPYITPFKETVVHLILLRNLTQNVKPVLCSALSHWRRAPASSMPPGLWEAERMKPESQASRQKPQTLSPLVTPIVAPSIIDYSSSELPEISAGK